MPGHHGLGQQGLNLRLGLVPRTPLQPCTSNLHFWLEAGEAQLGGGGYGVV